MTEKKRRTDRPLMKGLLMKGRPLMSSYDSPLMKLGHRVLQVEEVALYGKTRRL